MEKTGVVKEIKDLKKKDNYGNSSFIVEFDNGDKGYFRCKSEAPKFKVGETITYIIEEKEKSDKTGTYFSISLPKTEFKPNSGSGNGYKREPKSIRDYQLEARTFALAYTKDLIVASKIDIDEFKVKFLEMVEAYDDSLNTLSEGK